jgi:iron complex outermembrane receptor protein
MIELLLTLLMQAPAPATNTTPPAPIDVGRIDIGVTAEAPVGTALVTGETLQRLERRDLSQATELVPGVTLRRLGPRNEMGLFLRGFDLRQVPLFIDGFPVYVPYDGHLDLARFLTADVEEVRVSKGVASVLYGPNTLGGAVNVVSKQPSQPLEGTIGVQAGSGDDRLANLTFGTRRGAWSAIFSAAHMTADTFPLPDGSDRLNAYRRDTRAAVRAGYTAARWNVMAGSSLQRGEKASPPYLGDDRTVRIRYWRWPRWDKDDYWVVGSKLLGGAGYLRGRVWRDTFDSAQYMFDDATYSTQRLPSSTRSIYDDHTDGGSIEWGATLSRGLSLRAVAHAKSDLHTEFNEGEPERTFNDRVYSGGAEVTWTGSRVTLLAALSKDHLDARRAEDFQQGRILPFALHDTGDVNPQVSAAIALPKSGRLYGLVSRKTRLPVMRDRFSYRLGQALPNPELRAEHGVTVEAGYEVSPRESIAFSAAAHRTQVDDLVQRFVVRPNVFQFQNIGRVVHAGVELSARWRPASAFHTVLSYAFLDRRNLDNSAIPLLDTPKHHVAISPVWTPHSRVTLGASIVAAAKRPSQSEGGRVVMLDGFERVDAKGSVLLGRGVSIEASMLNAVNSFIELADGFPEPGRTWLAGLRWQF